MHNKSDKKSGFFNPRIIAAVALCSFGASLGYLSVASTPPTSSITVPSSSGQKVTVTWSGMIPPLANGTSDCTNLADTPLVDQHLPTVNVPNGVYNTIKAKFT